MPDKRRPFFVWRIDDRFMDRSCTGKPPQSIVEKSVNLMSAFDPKRTWLNGLQGSKGNDDFDESIVRLWPHYAFQSMANSEYDNF